MGRMIHRNARESKESILGAELLSERAELPHDPIQFLNTDGCLITGWCDKIKV